MAGIPFVLKFVTYNLIYSIPTSIPIYISPSAATSTANLSNNARQLIDNIYVAEVLDEHTKSKSHYIGSSRRSMAQRISKHESDIRLEKHTTTLTSRVLNLRELSHEYRVKFSRVVQAPSYQAGMTECYLCMGEIYQIPFTNNLEGHRLNDRKEIWATCRHKHRWKLKTVM